MSNEQRRVLAGMIAATAFSAAFFVVAFRLTGLALPLPNGGDTSWRLEYALKCKIFAALCLLAGVARIANRRFLMPDALGGAVVPALEIDERYLQNTLEQFVLAFAAHLALAVVLPASSLRSISLLAALFVIGRVTFWIGYYRSGPARAFGFAATFYPTVGAYAYVIWRLVW